MIYVLIPAYDEEKSIGNVIKETSKYVDKIIVIDDGSTDKTSRISRNLGAKVLRHPINKGLGAAIKTGIKYAKINKPDLIVLLDADGQHNPSDIPKIIQPIISGQSDFVLGSRFLYENPNMPKIKLFGNKLLSIIISIISKTMITDTQTGFRALNKNAFMDLNLEGDKTYVQEMIIELSLKGKKIQEVSIEINQRKHGNSKVTSNIFEYSIKTLIIIFKTYIKLRIQYERGV